MRIPRRLTQREAEHVNLSADRRQFGCDGQRRHVGWMIDRQQYQVGGDQHARNASRTVIDLLVADTDLAATRDDMKVGDHLTRFGPGEPRSCARRFAADAATGDDLQHGRRDLGEHRGRRIGVLSHCRSGGHDPDSDQAHQPHSDASPADSTDRWSAAACTAAARAA